MVLINNVKYGVVLVDETGRFAVVNPSFMQMFGLDNKLDIININSQDWGRWEVYGEDGKLLHVDDHPVRKVGLTGNPVKDQLVAVRNPGANKLTWMLISAEPILKEDGHIYRVICTYHDITERKKAEDKLKEILVHRFLINDIISYNNPTRNLFFFFYSVFPRRFCGLFIELFYV